MVFFNFIFSFYYFEAKPNNNNNKFGSNYNY